MKYWFAVCKEGQVNYRLFNDFPEAVKAAKSLKPASIYEKVYRNDDWCAKQSFRFIHEKLDFLENGELIPFSLFLTRGECLNRQFYGQYVI